MPGLINSPTSESDPDSVSFPLIFKSHIDNCQFSSWHPLYSKLTPKTKILTNLPDSFVEYLLEDGIILPPDDNELTPKIQDLSISDDIANYSDDGSEPPEDPTVKFPELHLQIKTAIESLGGAVLPKLNWSAPKDASWISINNTLKCTSPSDIYLLLKSSAYITHDLTEPYSNTVEATQTTNENEDTSVKPELVLRQWFNLNPALEFRCFVRDRTLVAVSQRDYLKYYPFLDKLKDTLADEIAFFFTENIKDTFPDDSFVFDVYIPNPYDRVYLIDINPFAPQTDPLLFTWYEILHKLDPKEIDEDFELRLVDKTGATSDLLGGALQHSENRVPKDIVDASMTGAGMAELARQWNAMLSGEKISDSEDDDDTEEN